MPPLVHQTSDHSCGKRRTTRVSNRAICRALASADTESIAIQRGRAVLGVLAPGEVVLTIQDRTTVWLATACTDQTGPEIPRPRPGPQAQAAGPRLQATGRRPGDASPGKPPLEVFFSSISPTLYKKLYSQTPDRPPGGPDVTHASF